MSLSRAQNTFMSANINSIVLLHIFIEPPLIQAFLPYRKLAKHPKRQPITIGQSVNLSLKAGWKFA